MLFRMLYDNRLAQAAYFIGCQKTGEAIVIDPERDVERYLDVAKEEDMVIVAIAETHIHADFLSGARELAERIGACLYLSDEGTEDWKYRWLDKKRGGGSYKHRLLKHGDAFEVGNIRFEAVHTPGHTPEHISFLVTDLGGGATEPMGIASGDFVFVGDVGRPDLLETAAGQVGQKEPAARTLFHSLQRFKELPEYLQVWPAHGSGSACGKALGAVPQSTVGYEKRYNASILQATDEEGFVSAVLQGQPEPPLYFARMKRENKEGPAVLGRTPEPASMDREQLSRLPTESVVLDTRSWKQFCAGHLPGALHTPLANTFPTVAGSYVEPENPIYLIASPEQAAEAAIYLIRIGLDKVVGYATPETLEEYRKHGGELATTTTMPPEKAETPEDVVLLDVRNASEYQERHVEGALNIAYTRLLPRLKEVPKEKRILVHCRTGARAAAATSLLQSRGYEVIHFAGNYEDLQKPASAI